MNANSTGEPEQITGIRVSRELFPLLCVPPAQGRGFLTEEDRAGGGGVAVIGDEFWRSRLGADTRAIGKSISIDGHVTTIIGILPSGFHFPFAAAEPQIWLPRVFELPGETPERIYSGMGYLSLIGRLRTRQTVERTRAELASIVREYQSSFPGSPDAAFPLAVSTIEEWLVANARPSLLALLAAVGFALSIACVNVVSFLA